MTTNRLPGTKLRHVVLFGFKTESTRDEIKEIARRFIGLRDLVPGISDVEWGENNSPEGKNHGLTHCFTLTFDSEEARDAYLPHPDHVAFATWARRWIEHVTVVDYWSNSGV